MEQRIGRRRSSGVDARRLERGDGRCDHPTFLIAHGALFAGMRIERRNCKTRTLDAEQVAVMAQSLELILQRVDPGRVAAPNGSCD